MSSRQAFALLTGVYYLALGVWTGALVMLAVAAAATFRTVRDAMPGLGETAQNMLAGSIVGNAINGLSVIQIICALVAGATLLLQCTAYANRLTPGIMNKLRVVLVIFAIVTLSADRAVIAPRLHGYRAAMHDTTTEEDARQNAKARFDRFHLLSERAAGAMMFLVAAALLASPFAWRDSTPAQEEASENGDSTG